MSAKDTLGNPLLTYNHTRCRARQSQDESEHESEYPDTWHDILLRIFWLASSVFGAGVGAEQRHDTSDDGDDDRNGHLYG